MQDPRADGPTFAPENIGWIDFETRSETPISAGTTRYATEANAIVLAFAIGEGPVQLVAVADLTAPLELEDMPTDFLNHARRVQQGEAVWAAWNAGFDRAIWNYATLGFPEMLPHHIIDVMAQATASGLPPDLKQAAIQSGSTCKVEDGKRLINLFCIPGSTATPESHPDEWELFLDYAAGDVEAMRSVFLGTRQLPLAEWQEYWAMEAINDRGIAIDLKMVEHAARLADEDAIRSNQELDSLTGGAVTTVNQVQRLTDWLLARLPEEGVKILTEVEEEIDENGEEITEARYQLTRKRVERLIAFNEDDTIDRVLQIRLYGGSKTPAKFAKMLQQHVDGRLYGQYVFNGAAQTGRASSKGVQIHNLARDTLDYEIEAIWSLEQGDDYRQFAAIGDNSPVARKLSLLIRPAFVPTVNSSVFVWSDWSQIEARVLPWLCDHLHGAAARLGTFRAVDADPDVPDLYTRTAADLAGISVDKVTRLQRQSGKVAELALGFCGGKGALQAMAANYGLFFDDADAQEIVDRWRKVNAWAVDYSQQLWKAALCAHVTYHTLIPAGRVAFYFYPDYLGGSLLCRLPSGRLLTYRKLRWEMIEEKNKDGLVIKASRELTYARGHGRAKLWPGVFVENVTQATAADVLRGTLVRLEQDGPGVRLHTHDEVLIEITEANADYASRALRDIMRRGFDWSEGLPLMSEETSAYYYTKNEGNRGL